MQQEIIETRFLPAERLSPREIARQCDIVASIPLLSETMDAVAEFVFVLNENRQILFANRAATKALCAPLESIAGLRFGELLGCVRSKREGGCGTSEYCAVCGAAQVMLKRSRGAPRAEQDCRMIVEAPAVDRELKVRATALNFGGLSLTLFVAEDRSGESRRRTLERLFFHDALNTAGSVQGIAAILPGAGQNFSLYCQLLRASADQLLEQIVSQRDLAGVENGEYRLKPSRCRIDPLLTAAADLISTHPAASGRPIRVESAPENLEIVTDRGLLMRVVGNLLKNAVEAESVGTAVRVGGAARADGGAEIWVRNPTAMPREVQLQLFQRAFTTKGAGRGQGTYSVRLLTERYLGGEVAFRSDAVQGTEFRVSLPAAVVSLDDAVGEVPPLE